MNTLVSLFWGTLIAGCLLAGVIAALGMVHYWRFRQERSGRRNPLTQDLLRGPGHSLMETIDDHRWNTALLLSFAMLPLPLAVAVYFVEWATREQRPSLFATLFLAIGAVAGLAVVLWKLWATLGRVQKLRLGFEAELAVGQELNDLGHLGYRVFHDIPVDERKFNVDHVVVGPAGVFAVETKGRAKPEGRHEGQSGWEVQYDGEALHFPGWIEKWPLEQAVAVANWVRDWLTSAVGDRVAVQSLLVLPGWYIKRTSGKGIPVLNGRQIGSYFSKLPRDARMDAEMIQRIAHQLDQRCRDVEPRAYATDKD